MPSASTRVEIDLRGSDDVRRVLEEAAAVFEQLFDRRTSFEEEIVLVEPLRIESVATDDYYDEDGDPLEGGAMWVSNSTTLEAIAALVRLGSNPALPVGTRIRITAEPPGHDDAGA